MVLAGRGHHFHEVVCKAACPFNFEEHPAPDPTEDPPTKDMVPPGSPLLHFRIVKVLMEPNRFS